MLKEIRLSLGSKNLLLGIATVNLKKKWEVLIMQDIISEFDKLDLKCKQLQHSIENSLDHNTKMSLKRDFHQTKLDMISLLDADDSHKGVTAADLIADVNSRKQVPRYMTGLTMLDAKLNGGIEVGTLIQLAGQSFAGKTHLVLEILTNISGAKECVLFNFEMGDVRIAKRLDKLLTTQAQLDNLIIDSRTRDIDMLVNEIRIYAKKGIKFFAIDSKMKITSSEKDDYKRFNEISSKLAKVTQENDLIVFLINQMNESDIKDGRFAFKGSGDQMYDTDIALFYTVEKNGERILTCNKNRQDEREFVLKSELKEDGRLEFVDYYA